ncbi:MAG: hypothetical protein TREMPRED_001355 [Tremellales sp. Tagirdzhanova-0007]|nr:MAG: hypothetical protein TREMPRED_001355 [Tremellales sp. Tagirdzhanova-0007]
MFAPPGVDYDSSSGESSYLHPEKSPPRPTFSLKSLLAPARKLSKVLDTSHEAEDLNKLTPVQAAEADPALRKKRVRIVVEGDEEVDERDEDLMPTLTSPFQSPTQQAAKLPKSLPTRDTKGSLGRTAKDVSSEVLTMLQKLIADPTTDRQKRPHGKTVTDERGRPFTQLDSRSNRPATPFLRSPPPRKSKRPAPLPAASSTSHASIVDASAQTSMDEKIPPESRKQSADKAYYRSS